MRKFVLMLAIVCLASITYAQQKSEPMKKTVVARLTIKKESVESFVQFAQQIGQPGKKPVVSPIICTKILLDRKLNLYFMKNIKSRLHWIFTIIRSI